TMPKKTQSEVGQSLEIYTNFFHPSVSFSLTGSERWVTPEVLPAIRKTGQYQLPNPASIQDPDERTIR
ncbi:MAG: hypothetical protein HW380_4023, partial [Magnetococcales bacterium]|nr:hypothetical protein [Magnetococcales bacterium]